MDFIEACRKFIAIDSTPDVGNLEIAHFAATLCREAGLYVEVQEESHNGLPQANVIARPVESVPNDEVLLQTHLDTVDPGSYGLWTKTQSNPFNASIYQDTIYGLGSADVKLDFLCKLKAIESFGHVSWRHPFVLAGTFGEELGMGGAIKLIRKKRISATKALIGEPTELRLLHAGKGFASVEIEIPFSDEERRFHDQHNRSESQSTQSRVFMGRAAHSSAPHLGESAIVKMLAYLRKLPAGIAIMEIEGGISGNSIPANAVLEIDMVGGLRNTIGQKILEVVSAIQSVEKEFRKYPDHSFTPPHPTLNIGMIRTYADSVKLSGCCRLPPAVTNEVYEGWMNMLRQACTEVGGSFRITDYKQPFRTAEGSQFLKQCQDQLRRIHLPFESGTLSATNEASVFSRFGMECVVFGPGQSVGNSHAPNEHVKIKQLQDAIEFYRGVIERVCL